MRRKRAGQPTRVADVTDEDFQPEECFCDFCGETRIAVLVSAPEPHTRCICDRCAEACYYTARERRRSPSRGGD